MYGSVYQAIIGSDNGLAPVWRQAIILTNHGLLIVLLEQISLKFESKYNKKTHFKLSSMNSRPFCALDKTLSSCGAIHL